jgi:hypothetical protein
MARQGTMEAMAQGGGGASENPVNRRRSRVGEEALERLRSVGT